LALLSALICGLPGSGCLVVSSNHVSKPVAPKDTVELRHDENADESTGWYAHHVHSSNVDFDVAVHNNAERLQVGFLFWVIPIPYTESWTPDAMVELNLRPTGTNIVIDPWNINLFPAEDVCIGPKKIWREENGGWEQIPRGQVSITKPESFRLEYDAVCNPDSPFTLAIADLPKTDRSQVIVIHYERAKLFHTGFRLPY
jgi:hypothetical protein